MAVVVAKQQHYVENLRRYSCSHLSVIQEECCSSSSSSGGGSDMAMERKACLLMPESDASHVCAACWYVPGCCLAAG